MMTYAGMEAEGVRQSRDRAVRSNGWRAVETNGHEAVSVNGAEAYAANRMVAPEPRIVDLMRALERSLAAAKRGPS